MSNVATNWAFGQVQLKPGPWRVLVMLADCHNPAYGCFPGQEWLARHCNMSRASVNRHLDALEDEQLIRRRSYFDKATGQRTKTRYFLAFETDFPRRNLRHGDEPESPDAGETPSRNLRHGETAENGSGPCLKIHDHHVSNCDNNPVREPVSSNPPYPPETGGDDPDTPEMKPVPAFEDLARGFPDPDLQDLKGARKLWDQLTDYNKRRAFDHASTWREKKRGKRGKARLLVKSYLAQEGWVVSTPKRSDGSNLRIFGPDWMLLRFEILLKGPDSRNHLGFADWRSIRDFDGKTKAMGGWKRPPEGWRRPDVETHPVPVDTERFAEWRTAFDALQWPWIPDPLQTGAVHFPACDPPSEETLADFVAMFSPETVGDDA